VTGSWWQSRAAVAGAALAATIPLWFVQLPPLIDLLGHMGRYHVQLNLADSPQLQANWDYHWRLIGNLGSDLLMEPLGRTLGVERGAVVLASLILIVMITGMARLARAAHGALPATFWAALPFAMSYPWHYGLVNYWLGVGCALHVAAFYFRRPFAWWLLALASVALWVVHIYGWAVFGVLIAARTITGVGWRDWPKTLLALWPAGAPALLMLGLSTAQTGSTAETLGWFEFGYKALALTWTLRDQHQWLDIACLIAATLLIYAGLRGKSFALDRALGLGALGLLLATLVIPYQLLGSAYADARLWPAVFIVALLAIRPTEATGKLANAVALAAIAIFVVRLAATTIGFQAYDADYARHLAGLDKVPRGAKLAVFVEFPCDVAWRRPRLDHLDGIAIVRREVFTNAQWDVAGAQTLVPLGATGTAFNADPSQLVRSGKCPADLRPHLARYLNAFPRDRFDHVWVVGYRPETLPRYAGLEPLFADDRTILYRIEK